MPMQVKVIQGDLTGHNSIHMQVILKEESSLNAKEYKYGSSAAPLVILHNTSLTVICTLVSAHAQHIE